MWQLRLLLLVVVISISHVTSLSLSTRELNIYRRRNSDCYIDLKGTDYRGDKDYTMPEPPGDEDAVGETCRYWTDPDLAGLPWYGLATHNHCRNPDGDARPWCYISDINAEWRFCNVGPVSTSCGGGGTGDPHMVTFDGIRFDFQGYCTYVLVRDCRHSGYSEFEITADFRGKQNPIKPPTRMVAIKIAVTGIPRITLLEDNSYMIGTEVFFNGTNADLGENMGTVVSEGNTVTVQINEPKLSISWNGKPHKVMIWLNDEGMIGNICGMLGNADGDPENDFIKPNGESVDDTDAFGNSWAVPGSCPRF